MTTFSHAELAYLQGERRLARLATADADGQPHVVPVGMWSYNAALNTIDVTGRDFASTYKYRNVRSNRRAALVVDDLASVDPWRPRALLIQGPAEAVPPQDAHTGLIRITPARIVSWGLDTQ